MTGIEKVWKFVLLNLFITSLSAMYMYWNELWINEKLIVNVCILLFKCSTGQGGLFSSSKISAVKVSSIKEIKFRFLLDSYYCVIQQFFRDLCMNTSSVQELRIKKYTCTLRVLLLLWMQKWTKLIIPLFNTCTNIRDILGSSKRNKISNVWNSCCIKETSYFLVKTKFSLLCWTFAEGISAVQNECQLQNLSINPFEISLWSLGCFNVLK